MPLKGKFSCYSELLVCATANASFVNKQQHTTLCPKKRPTSSEVATPVW